MTLATIPPPRQTGRTLRPRPARPVKPPGLPWRWLAALVLGGYLVFCHGCHSDTDDELGLFHPAPPARER